jgi:hypothetical protein
LTGEIESLQGNRMKPSGEREPECKSFDCTKGGEQLVEAVGRAFDKRAFVEFVATLKHRTADD